MISRVSALTLAEAQALDAGYWFTQDIGKTFPYRGVGLTVPTFEEVLDAHAGDLIAIEIKNTDLAVVEQVVDEISSRDLYEEVYVWSFEPDITEALRLADPDLEVGLTLAESFALAALSDEEEQAYVPPGSFAQIPLHLNGISILNQALTERCERVGVRLHAWTVNDPADMQDLIGWGVRGIITDNPSTLEDVLNDVGMP